MVRISKVGEIRNKSPRSRRAPVKKTGPLKDKLPLGYKEQKNALEAQLATSAFIPKIK